MFAICRSRVLALNACFVLAQPLQAAQDWLGMPEPKKRAEGPDRSLEFCLGWCTRFSFVREVALY